jgi:predicted DCC family thiol-disulfide oxidoreductase YuxK
LNVQEFLQSKGLTVPHKPIFFFDGFCNLCSGVVNFIMKHEKQPEILFCSLQSNFAKELFGFLQKNITETDTSYVLAQGKLYEKSAGPMYLAAFLRYPWAAIKIFRIVPLSIRNWMYSFVAKRRYVLFGKKTSCRIPTAAEKVRFLE